MAITGYCPECNEPMYDWRRHRCPDKWLCWESGGLFDESPEDGAHHIYAASAETAAEKYAEWSDNQGDYVCIGGETLQITVRHVETRKEETFTVSAELLPTYAAYRKGD